MDRERYGRVREVFAAALALEPERREEFLETTCASDADLRAEVQSLLDRAGAPHRLLDDTTPGASAREEAERALGAGQAGEPSLPATIAQYRVLRMLGEGASAVVFEAEQERPKRRVALKVLRSGLTTPEVVRRFEREAEILARLRHPGIAHVHEVGVTRLGGVGSPAQPFFAMELVEGRRLTEHATRAGLSVRERLELVAQCCDAVEHAHSRGVVHRDLKPANILVDESGRPKVLDFGVARALDPELSSTTLRTGTGQVVGTLPYMSPEQVSGRPDAIDARCDVHALGVIAFELLAGRLPHALDGISFPEAARVIREDDAARLGSLDRALKGDVETIVAKALEKEPARRYPSAAAMAADIRRCISGEPISARPTSALRQAGRFARRHRTLVTGVVAAFLALLLGTAVAVRQAVVARRNEAAALRQAYRASIAAAVASLRGDDAALARAHLAAAPDALRGWEWRLLEGQLDGSVRRVKGPRGLVYAIRMGEDGSIATHRVLPEADVRTSVAISWDAAAGTHESTSPLGERPVRAGRVDPWMVTRSMIFREGEREVEILGEGDRVVARLRPCDPHVASRVVALAADGRRALLEPLPMLAAGDAVTWMPCDLGTGERAGPTLAGRRLAVEVTRDFRLLATTDGRGGVELREIATGTPERSLAGRLDYVFAIAFSPDGARIATGSSNALVQLFSVDDGTLLGEARPAGMRGIGAVAFSPDGRLLGVGGDDGSVRLFEHGLERATATLLGHASGLVALAIGSDDAFSLDSSGTLMQWELSGGRSPGVLRGHESYVNPVAFAPSGEWLASGGWDGSVRIWDATTWRERRVMRLGEDVFVSHLGISPDGTRLIAGTVTGGIRLLDAASGVELDSRVERHRGGAVAWRPGHDEVAVALEDEPGPGSARAEVHLVDAATLSTRQVLPLRGAPRRWSADGRILAIDEMPGLGLLDVSTGRTAGRLPTGEGAVLAVAFGPDDRTLVTGDVSGRLAAWDLDTSRAMDLPGMEEGPIYSAAFSPDGSRLAVGGDAGVIHLWDPTTWVEVAQLHGHESYVFSLAWSPDGETLASGSGDGTVRLWSTRSASELFAARQRAGVSR